MVILTRRMGHWRSGAAKRPALLLLALTILLSGLLGALPAPRAHAQATPATVTVRLTIDSVTAVDGFEGGGTADCALATTRPISRQSPIAKRSRSMST